MLITYNPLLFRSGAAFACLVFGFYSLVTTGLILTLNEYFDFGSAKETIKFEQSNIT